MKLKSIIILILIVIIAFFCYHTTQKNEYIRDIKKVLDYVNDGIYDQTIISLFKDKEFTQAETLAILNYDKNPEDFISCIDLLDYVSHYKYDSNQIVNKSSKHTLSVKYTVQVEIGNDTKIYNLSIFFDKEFYCFGIPRGYTSENPNHSNIIFYKISDEKMHRLAENLFEMKK